MDAFGLHHSEDLRQLFAGMEVPYQGQDPKKARVVFVGTDANYSPALHRHTDFFERILEYHRDGVAFWHRHGIHHPFLLPEYPLPKNSGGVPYHRKFASMGLTAEYAEHISFVELLDLPTTGRVDTKTFWHLFNPDHARRLDHLLSAGDERVVLLSNNVILRMKEARDRFGLFPWLPGNPAQGLFHQIGSTRFYKVMHFSVSVSTAQLNSLASLIRASCRIPLIQPKA